jgi:molybdopterin-biosynthesis enzyme MoeA-like protein
MGIFVKRITVVTDDISEISKIINETLERKTRFTITTGGLGPTFDDKTLQGIAKALNRKLEVSRKALEMVKDKYKAYVKTGKIEKAELTGPRVKMATLPEGSEPICNPIGTAPGVIMKVEDSVLIALPGVPPEMEAIFDESIAPLLKKEAGQATFFETSVYADNIMESSLAPLIDKTMQDNPFIYIKSHPRSEERKPHLEIHFSTTSKNSKTAKSNIQKAISQLSKLIKENAGKVRLKKEENQPS